MVHPPSQTLRALRKVALLFSGNHRFWLGFSTFWLSLVIITAASGARLVLLHRFANNKRGVVTSNLEQTLARAPAGCTLTKGVGGRSQTIPRGGRQQGTLAALS